MQLVDVSYLAGLDSLPDALKGRYGYDGQKNIMVTVVKGIGHVFTPIASTAMDIDYKLPECYDFYCPVCNGYSVRFIQVTGSHLRANLTVGEQINVTFKIK